MEIVGSSKVVIMQFQKRRWTAALHLQFCMELLFLEKSSFARKFHVQQSKKCLCQTILRLNFKIVFTECVRDMDKLQWVKLGCGGFV